MQPTIDRETGRDLISRLSGEYVVQLCDGVWLYTTELPGDTVSAATHTLDGDLHIFIDPEKPDCYAHVRFMLHESFGIEYSVMDAKSCHDARFV